jgi:LmbE family N-acetylglucosaminyl deacetylase
MGTKTDAMVIAPHPDDAEFGAGGTAARWVREGMQVILAVCTNGDKGTEDRTISPAQLAEIREEEQRAAAHIIGFSEVIFLGYPDQGLEDSGEFRKAIVRLLRMYQPKTVVTSDPYRRYVWHRDHRMTGQVVLDAVFPYARDHLAYPDLLEENLEPHKVADLLFWAAEDINHRSDVTETFGLKMDALRCHRSQFKEANLHQMEKGLKERCRAMAEGEDYELAEGFHRIVLPR